MELCEHPERGCPLAALSPELARATKRLKPQIAAELVNYKNRMLPFMPGGTGTEDEIAKGRDETLALFQAHPDAVSVNAIISWWWPNTLGAVQAIRRTNRQGVRVMNHYFSLAENLSLHDYRKPPESHFGWLSPMWCVTGSPASSISSHTALIAVLE